MHYFLLSDVACPRMSFFFLCILQSRLEMSDLVEKGFTLKNLDTGKRTTQHHLDLYYKYLSSGFFCIKVFKFRPSHDPEEP